MVEVETGSKACGAVRRHRGENRDPGFLIIFVDVDGGVFPANCGKSQCHIHHFLIIVRPNRLDRGWVWGWGRRCGPRANAEPCQDIRNVHREVHEGEDVSERGDEGAALRFLLGLDPVGLRSGKWRRPGRWLDRGLDSGCLMAFGRALQEVEGKAKVVVSRTERRGATAIHLLDKR